MPEPHAFEAAEHAGPAAPKPYAPDELRALDRAHVWHPYGPMPGRQEPLIVESASGVRLRLAEPVEGRRELVDGMSSWWSAVHGYNHPVLNEAARGQLDRMSHVMFGGLTHEPAVRLATRLVEITPGRSSTSSSPTRGPSPWRSRSRCASSTGVRPGVRPSDGC